MSNKTPRIEINLDELSAGAMLRLMETETRALRVQQLAKNLQDDGSLPDGVDTDGIINDIMTSYRAPFELFAIVVTHLDAEMFVGSYDERNSPDYSNPDTYLHLKERCVDEIKTFITEARQAAAKEAKN